MKKYLVIGIVFILFQVIAIYQGIQDGREYENIGQVIGSFIPAMIGIASLAKYFKNK